jgi:hypothetical protein
MLLFNVFSVGIISHIFFTTFFPNEYHIFLLNASFYAILMYSYVEIFAKKICNNPYIFKIKSLIKNSSNNEIEIVKFNKIIFSTNKKNIKAHNLLLYDFIIFSDHENVTQKNQIVNKILYYGFPSIPFNFNYNLCKFTFIALNVTLLQNGNGNCVSYPIKLSNEYENYYIIGNKINRLLICYLLKLQHGIMCDEICEKYTLELIDHMVEIKKYSEKDEIILYENDYKIIPFFHIDTTNMTIKEIINNCDIVAPSENKSDSKYEDKYINDSDSISE